jgi:hypothetical protein
MLHINGYCDTCQNALEYQRPPFSGPNPIAISRPERINELLTIISEITVESEDLRFGKDKFPFFTSETLETQLAPADATQLLVLYQTLLLEARKHAQRNTRLCPDCAGLVGDLYDEAGSVIGLTALAPKVGLVKALQKLTDFIPRTRPSNFTAENANYQRDDERTPFFSESFLYTLVGKSDARYILAKFYDLGLACGFSNQTLMALGL